MDHPKTAGSPAPSKYTNRLIHETSPYLRQHAHNPVEWYPWGPEALEKANRENKPILLSIGYSACHWCHVMEKESFENHEIAQIMNRQFVNVKVDREERPDLDTIYMNYVQMSTGGGGWPMTVFLTPGQVPFYGGTYFPPDDRYGRPGFPKVLKAVADAYQEKQREIEKQGPEIVRSLEQINLPLNSAGRINGELLDSAYENLAQRFDWTYGGIGGAPKFPNAMNLSFCLRYHLRAADREARRFVELSLDKMAYGGMYDQLGGGFHRYSVDDRWMVPHFEKMLYDNALLSRLYLEAYQLTRKPLYRRVTEEILDYVSREMISPEGGFYSTQDADSEGEEGRFFVWRPEEIQGLLRASDAQVVCRHYGVTAAGNFEGANILHVARLPEDLAVDVGLDPAALVQLLAESRTILFREREKRVKPHRDEKILTSWNAMMSISFAEAGMAFLRPDYLALARRNVQFLLDKLCTGDQVHRTFSDGQAKLAGYLEDYAGLVEVLISLYEATGEPRWLESALSFNEELLRQFWDEPTRGFFLTGTRHEMLITRVRDFYDNATPAGSSVAVLNLLRLAILNGNAGYREIAEHNLESMAIPMSRFPERFGYLLTAADFYLGPVREIVLVGGARAPETTRLSEAIYSHYVPKKVVARLDPSGRDSAHLALLEGKSLVGGKPAVYICRDHSCQSPITDGSELERQLREGS